MLSLRGMLERPFTEGTYMVFVSFSAGSVLAPKCARCSWMCFCGHSACCNHSPAMLLCFVLLLALLSSDESWSSACAFLLLLLVSSADSSSSIFAFLLLLLISSADSSSSSFAFFLIRPLSLAESSPSSLSF